MDKTKGELEVYVSQLRERVQNLERRFGEMVQLAERGKLSFLKFEGKLGAHATQDMVVRSQVFFRPDELVIKPECASRVEVLDIRIGRNSMMLSGQGIPGWFFADSETDRPAYRFACSTAQVTQDIMLRIHSLSPEPMDFSAVLRGPAIDSIAHRDEQQIMSTAERDM